MRADAAWEPWLLFMLAAVAETSTETLRLIDGLAALMADYKKRIRDNHPRLYSQDLLNNLFRHPYTRIEFLADEVGVVRQTERFLHSDPPAAEELAALRREAASYALTVIDDTADTEDALKAELRFYNLAAGCSAANLLLAPAGTAVFSAVAASASAARSVNPVRASLAGQCGHAKTAPQSLPHLEPGDHLSLFLTGSAAAPQLVIQPSRTDPFTR